MESQKIQFVGESCGQHGPYTFYKAFKYFRDNKFRILTLGEFFFLKILKEGPICVGELQLIWENSQEQQFLASIRLYYLPEHTPAGRESYHGEHEILAFSDKLILKLDDLVSVIYLDHVEWGSGLSLLQEDSVEGDVEPASLQTKFFANTKNSGLVMDDVQKEIEDLDAEETTSTCVKVFSFPQYCRYRGIMKRLENMADKWLKKELVCALGGITSNCGNNRIMFCRDTFDDPDLDELEVRMDHLAPNLKGRPRKKRTSKGDGNGDSDSNETSSDISTPSSRVKASKRESALRNGYKLDKDRVNRDEQAFLIDLHKFMKKRHTPIDRIPSLGFKQIDLWYFYSYARKLGGYDQITRKRLWKHLYDVLGGNPGSTSAATCTRRHYEKLLLPYERYLQEESPSKNVMSHRQKRKAELLAKARAEAKERLQDEQDSDYDIEEEEKNRSFRKRRRSSAVELFQKRTLSAPEASTEKVELWEKIRKHQAVERDKMKKVYARNTKTVKSLLNNAEKEKSYLEIKAESNESTDVTIESTTQENRKIEASVVKLEKLNVASATTEDDKLSNDSKSLVSQSRLFRADPVQSSVPGTEANVIQLDRTRLPPHLSGQTALPAGGMFYPPFIHMGGMHPLNLPVMHHLPVSMQQFMSPPLQQAKSAPSTDKNSYRPNILRPTTHSSSASSPSSDQRPSVIHHSHQSKSSSGHSSGSSKDASRKSHNVTPHVVPTYVSGSAPKAHSGTSSALKRSYSSPVPSEAHIPHSHRKHSSNRSLLFDFEAPKRSKMESQPDHGSSVKSSSVAASETELPFDLSMKTLRKIEPKDENIRDRNGETVTNRRSNSSALSDESPFSVKSLARSSVSPSSRYASPSVLSRSHLLLDRDQGPDASVFSKASRSLPPAHGSNKGSDRPLVPPPAHSHKTSNPSQKSSSSSSLASAVPASGPTMLHSPTDHLHPAFPNHMVRPQFPQQPYFPTPIQLHQFFEAQIRANAAQAAAYEEMMSHDRGAYGSVPLPMFLPQVPFHAQAAKDKSHYTHAK